MIDASQYPFIQRILEDAETGREVYLWSKASVAALAAELHSLLTSNAVNAKLAAEWEAKHRALRTQIAEMGREMASVVAERDALKAQQPKVERKLREYKGVTYRDGQWWHNDLDYSAAVSICHYGDGLHDADFPAIYALKDDPYEPVETVEEVLRDAMRACYLSGGATIAEMVSKYATRLRAAFAAEQGGAE